MKSIKCVTCHNHDKYFKYFRLQDKSYHDVIKINPYLHLLVLQ